MSHNINIMYGVRDQVLHVPAHTLAAAQRMAESITLATRIPAVVYVNNVPRYDVADPKPVVLRR